MSKASPPILDTSSFPPGGWTYFEARTGWSIGDKSFDVTVAEYFKHCQGNPGKDLPNERAECERRVAVFNCAKNDYDPRYCESQTPAVIVGAVNANGVSTPIPPPNCKTCGPTT